MIKVTETKTIEKNFGLMNCQAWKDVLVAPAKLVLIEMGFAGTYHLQINDKWIKPILISETEKIEEDDWYYYTNKDGFSDELGHIFKSTRRSPAEAEENYKKILALPEHFSPQTLQDIVDGKLKDGDKLYVECFKQVLDDNSNESGLVFDFIKLNPHITLHKIEEKMYTREEVMKLTKEAMLYTDDFSNYPKIKQDSIHKEWFDHNVK